MGAQGWGDDHYRQVAQVYMEAADNGDPPTRAVEQHFDVPRPTAGRWVAVARRAGHLRPAGRPGYSAMQNATLIAVAEAVGVPVELLHAAVVKHARGRLCVSPELPRPYAKGR